MTSSYDALQNIYSSTQDIPRQIENAKELYKKNNDVNYIMNFIHDTFYVRYQNIKTSYNNFTEYHGYDKRFRDFLDTLEQLKHQLDKDIESRQILNKFDKYLEAFYNLHRAFARQFSKDLSF